MDTRTDTEEAPEDADEATGNNDRSGDSSMDGGDAAGVEEVGEEEWVSSSESLAASTCTTSVAPWNFLCCGACESIGSGKKLRRLLALPRRIVTSLLLISQFGRFWDGKLPWLRSRLLQENFTASSVPPLGNFFNNILG